MLDIKLNEKNFKNRKKFDNDVDLNNLVFIFINFHNFKGIPSFIRLMLYSLNKNDYEEIFYHLFKFFSLIESRLIRFISLFFLNPLSNDTSVLIS